LTLQPKDDLKLNKIYINHTQLLEDENAFLLEMILPQIAKELASTLEVKDVYY
jgi:hypothetical protein